MAEETFEVHLKCLICKKIYNVVIKYIVYICNIRQTNIKLLDNVIKIHVPQNREIIQVVFLQELLLNYMYDKLILNMLQTPPNRVAFGPPTSTLPLEDRCSPVLS